MNLKSLNLKFLIKAHTKIGLFALFFFYTSALFGTITLFLPQIKQWESPSRYFIEEASYNYTLDKLINRTIKEEGFSTQKVEITLPNYRDNVIAINDPSSRTKYVNPYTLKMLDTTSDRSFLSKFFNDIHIGNNIPKIGQFLMGIASILTIFLILSGVILFINKHRTKGSFNFKWHRDISLIILPYILVFALTGSVLGFMLNSSSPFAYAATKAETTSMRSLVGPIIFPKESIPKKSTQAVMMNIDELINKVNQIHPNLEISKITLFQWYDKNAKIKFSGQLKNNRILTGRINRQYITLKGNNGILIDKKDLSNSHFGNRFLSAFYYFHFITDEKLVIRIIYLVLGICFLGSLAFGFLIWSEKQASKFNSNRLYYNFLSRFSIAVMFGVFPAIALTLFLYWAIPAELFQRVLWIKGSFYLFWAFTLVLSAYFEDVLDLLKSLALFCSLFLFATIIAHIMNATTAIATLIQSEHMHSVLYFDLTLLILSILCFLFYKYAHKIKFIAKYSRRYYGS